jgi:hypothetical protein
MYLANLA